MTDVPTGQYKLFAWTNAPEGAWTNSEFLEKYEELGTAVNVRSGMRSADSVVNLIPIQ